MKPKGKSTLDAVRGVLIREFCAYAQEHTYSLTTPNAEYCVPVAVFYPLVAYAVRRDTRQHVSQLYIDSVLHNMAVRTVTVRNAEGAEEALYVTSKANLQRLLTL